MPRDDDLSQEPDPKQLKDRFAGVFSRSSSTYDTVGRPMFSHFGKLLVEYVGIGRGNRVLDVASGAGAITLPAAERVGSKGKVVAVDLAEGMVGALQSRVDERGLAQVEVRQGDAENLPFQDQEFDVVFCAFGVFFFPDTPKAIREFARVLRPGGSLGLSTFEKDQQQNFKWLFELMGAFTGEQRRPRMMFDEPQQLHDLLAPAGFTDIEVTGAPFELVLDDAEQWWDWVWSAGLRGPLEAIAEAGKLDEFKAAAFERLAEMPGAPKVTVVMDALLTKARKP